MKGKERNGDKEEMKEWRVIGEDCIDIGILEREGGRQRKCGERETHKDKRYYRIAGNFQGSKLL